MWPLVACHPEVQKVTWKVTGLQCLQRHRGSHLDSRTGTWTPRCWVSAGGCRRPRGEGTRSASLWAEWLQGLRRPAALERLPLSLVLHAPHCLCGSLSPSRWTPDAPGAAGLAAPGLRVRVALHRGSPGLPVLPNLPWLSLTGASCCPLPLAWAPPPSPSSHPRGPLTTTPPPRCGHPTQVRALFLP